jgi:hypothetical protein
VYSNRFIGKSNGEKGAWSPAHHFFRLRTGP